MKKLAFIIALGGIFILIASFMLPAEKVDSLEDLELLELNQKVLIEGLISSERIYGEFRILSLNGISLTCNCKESYVQQNVKILGKVAEYEGLKQIDILRISKED